MPLPDLIEIVPPAGPVTAEITVPGSKSITNRALILAALAEGETTLRGALWSEDTEVMVACLRKLGFAVEVTPEADEPANRLMRVRGMGGKIPAGGTAEAPLELFVGNAGTAARFLAAMVCLGSGVYRLSGVPRMHERPQAALFAALRELGYRIDSPNDKLPALIQGGGRRPGSVAVSVGESSQFASALLLSAKVGGWEVAASGANDDELPYVEMTRELVKVFPRQGGDFQIEPDASSGSYFWGARTLLNWPENFDRPGGSKVIALNWPTSHWQVDARFKDYSERSIPVVAREGDSEGGQQAVLGDSIMTAIVMAPREPMTYPPPKRFTHLGRLRVQECERVVALRTELTKCGAKVTETGDTLEVFPSDLHGATIDTYHDHRMAMCFATLGLKVPGMKIRNPSCVKKTFPNFFQKLAAPPPHGLGATIWACDPVSGERTRILTGPGANPDDLFAA
jgi:3-phosphoshikimate 1-carboxyvinyltransferase